MFKSIPIAIPIARSSSTSRSSGKCTARVGVCGNRCMCGGFGAGRVGVNGVRGVDGGDKDSEGGSSYGR